MFLNRRDLPGIAGGAAFVVIQLLLAGFEKFLQPLLGGLIFIAVWLCASRVFKNY